MLITHHFLNGALDVKVEQLDTPNRSVLLQFKDNNIPIMLTMSLEDLLRVRDEISKFINGGE